MPVTPKVAVMEKFPSYEHYELLNPDELQLILEALRWYAQDSPEGRRSSGRLTWVREKVVRAKLHGHHLVPLAAD
tara:strand:+ start:968 stop:1192 length:225 start_codon:yes stop_codon:yes gene_type:complete